VQAITCHVAAAAGVAAASTTMLLKHRVLLDVSTRRVGAFVTGNSALSADTWTTLN